MNWSKLIFWPRQLRNLSLFHTFRPSSFTHDLSTLSVNSALNYKLCYDKKMEHIIKMKGTEERSFLQIREETFDVQIKRTKPKAWCVNGSVRALFGKLGHACLSEEKPFPCKAALRPLSRSLFPSLPRSLAHSSPRCAGNAGFLSADFPSLPLPPLGDVSYLLWSFLRLKNRVEHG